MLLESDGQVTPLIRARKRSVALLSIPLGARNYLCGDASKSLNRREECDKPAFQKRSYQGSLEIFRAGTLDHAPSYPRRTTPRLKARSSRRRRNEAIPRRDNEADRRRRIRSDAGTNPIRCRARNEPKPTRHAERTQTDAALGTNPNRRGARNEPNLTRCRNEPNLTRCRNEPNFAIRTVRESPSGFSASSCLADRGYGGL
jgi:hypothetical protein